MNARRAGNLRFVVGLLLLAVAAAVLVLIVFSLPGPVPPVVWAASAAGGIAAGAGLFWAKRLRSDPQNLHLTLALNAMDALLHLGGDGRIAFASPAAQNILGLPPEDLRRRSIAEFAVGRGRGEIQGALARSGYFGAETTAVFQVRTGEGAARWAELRLRPLLPQGRAPAKVAAASFQMVAVLRDITEAKTAEATLRAERDEAVAAAHAKSWFLANMSHELRTPLNAIIGFSEMMTAEMFGPLGNERYREYALHVRESGEHLRDLINDVLDVSKIEAGRFAVEFEAVSVPRILDETLKTVSVTARRRKVRLHVEFAEGLPQLVADRRALKQMLLNLLANAIKFTAEGGRVSASARVEEGDMVIAVRDTGVGISEDAIVRLARPYEQARERAARAPRLSVDERADKGTGLGLALVKVFAELHGGRLELESEEGKGTRAAVRLPLLGPEGEEGERAPAAPIDLASRRVA